MKIPDFSNKRNLKLGNLRKSWQSVKNSYVKFKQEWDIYSNNKFDINSKLVEQLLLFFSQLNLIVSFVFLKFYQINQLV
jgi:hypothetical protein